MEGIEEGGIHPEENVGQTAIVRPKWDNCRIRIFTVVTSTRHIREIHMAYIQSIVPSWERFHFW